MFRALPGAGVAALHPGTMALCASPPRYDGGDEDCETGADWYLALAFNAEGDFLSSDQSLWPQAEQLPTNGPDCSPRPHDVAGSDLSSIFRRSRSERSSLASDASCGFATWRTRRSQCERSPEHQHAVLSGALSSLPEATAVTAPPHWRQEASDLSKKIEVRIDPQVHLHP